MNRLQWLVVVLFSFASTSALLAQVPEKDSREKLETAIPEAIRLLEAMEYAKLLNTFVDPSHIKRITERAPVEEFAKQFGKEKATRLLKALKAIKGLDPKLDEAGKKATYTFKEPIGGKPTISFIKVDKFWYIHD